MKYNNKILFLADDHYKARPGLMLAEKLKTKLDIEFHENDWSPLEQEDLKSRYKIIILNLISHTCGIEPPSAKAEKILKEYLEAGGSMLLCHGSSAAFWHWDWWRPLVGFRWVRSQDPDGAEPSTHPKRPYVLRRAKCSHPLVKQLKEAEFPEDEIYIHLEQTCPATILMETTTLEGTFPQVYIANTPWGGQLISSLPGHAAEVVQSDANVTNSLVLIEALLGNSANTES